MVWAKASAKDLTLLGCSWCGRGDLSSMAQKAPGGGKQRELDLGRKYLQSLFLEQKEQR